MADDIGDIAAFYDSSLEQEDRRLETHQLEYDLTWRYLERYLPPRGTILEVGAATGRYTLALAKRGYAVTAVDLSAVLLDKNKEYISSQGLGQHVRYVVADSRDLRAVTKTDYDAALLMGPLYHLVVAADRYAALKEVFDRLRGGGILFSTLLSRYGILGEMLKKNPAWIEDRETVRWLMAHGRRPDHHERGGFRGYMAEVSEVVPLHESAGFETIILAGVEPAISADDESYNQLEGEQRRLWLDLFEAVSAEPSTVGASRHLLYIGRKMG